MLYADIFFYLGSIVCQSGILPRTLCPPNCVGLDIDGLRSANGVAPSIPVGKALLQGRAGLRLYKAKPKETGTKSRAEFDVEIRLNFAKYCKTDQIHS